MSKTLIPTLAVALLGIAVTASAADAQKQLSPIEQYQAACVAAGYPQSEVGFQDCVRTLTQIAKSGVVKVKGQMAAKACTLAGFAAGSAQLNECVEKIETSITDDARDNG